MWPFQKTYTQTDINEAVSQAMDLAYGHANDTLLDHLHEASQSAEMVLAREDKGWLLLSGDDGILTDAQRAANVKLARLYWSLDGLAKQIVNLWAYFGVGAGITYRVSGDKAAGQKTLDIIEAYMESPQNQVALSNQGQMLTAIKMLVDGEVFRPFFGEADVKVRWFDPLQMTLATDPDDKYTTRWYVRDWIAADNKHHSAVYCDRDNTDQMPGITTDQKIIKPGNADIVENVVVSHTKINSIGLRGESILTTSLDWCKAHRQFMRARVSIQQSLARYAQKVTSKGTQAQLTALANKLDSTLGTTGSEDNPPPAAGSQWYENQNTTLTNMKQETGSAAAQVDGSMIMQQVGVGAGIFPHYFGGGEAFRLATATAMESPMLRGFGTFRSLLHDMYQDDFAYVLGVAGVKDAKVQVDSQDIVPEQVASVVNALDKILQRFPGFVESGDVKKRALNVLGVADADAVIKELKNQTAETGVTETATGRAILHRFLRMLQETKGGSGHED